MSNLIKEIDTTKENIMLENHMSFKGLNLDYLIKA